LYRLKTMNRTLYHHTTEATNYNTHHSKETEHWIRTTANEVHICTFFSTKLYGSHPLYNWRKNADIKCTRQWADFWVPIGVMACQESNLALAPFISRCQCRSSCQDSSIDAWPRVSISLLVSTLPSKPLCASPESLGLHYVALKVNPFQVHKRYLSCF
jgi:hypothetical protein